jgi:hypothetical protein
VFEVPSYSIILAVLWKSEGLKVKVSFLIFLVRDSEYSKSAGANFFLWYLWLTIQNTAFRQVRNLFCLLAEFISISWRAAATNEPYNRIPKPGGLKTCVLLYVVVALFRSK